MSLDSTIEKCSSPIGDGNDYEWFVSDDPYIIEKCSSPIGDGNFEKVLFASLQVTIEKCSSPIGDGNTVSSRSLILPLN